MSMPLEGKNRKVYSYNNKDKSGCNFMYKDFEKTNSYHTNFSQSNFSYVSFRAAHLKFCNFYGAIFIGTEFVGTNLRGSSFKGATFKDAIFIGTVFDKTNFTGANFENCIFNATKINGITGLDSSSSGIRVLTQMPSADDFSSELVDVVQSLRNNDIIRKSHTLHTKNNGINTIYINELLRDYSEEELIRLLPKIENLITTQFYTLSYIKKLLQKASCCATI